MTTSQVSTQEPASAGFFVPERQNDAERLNELANHPAIYPWVRGPHKGALDLSPVTADPDNIVLAGEHGAEIFIPIQPGIYEAHSMCLPEGRGPWMVGFVEDCLRHLFTRTDCVEVVTRCPTRQAVALAKRVGLTCEFTNPKGWLIDGKQVSADIYALRVQDWMRLAPGLEERGHWFHDRLEQEFARMGRTEPQHDDDPVHDRYVGAAVEMMFGGQPMKGQIFYNRFAQLADYHPIRVMREGPLVVDIGNAILVIRNGDFYVASLQSEH